MTEKTVHFYAVRDRGSDAVILFDEIPFYERADETYTWVSGCQGLPVDKVEFAKLMGGWVPLAGERFTVKIKIKRDANAPND